MKKLVSVVLVMMMCVCVLCACGGGEDGQNTLVMATNAYFPPYEYYEGEAIVGIDVEIAQAIADKLGMELEVQDMEFASILTAVQSGKADIGMAGMTVTEERLESVNFSISYATGIQSIIVLEGSDIASVDDLAGHMIGVQLSTTGDIYATDEFGSDYVIQYNKGADAILALLQGKVDAVIIDNQPAINFVAANEGLVILDTEYAIEEYAACIAQDNEELLTQVNQALEELIADGTVQAILDKYNLLDLYYSIINNCSNKLLLVFNKYYVGIDFENE